MPTADRAPGRGPLGAALNPYLLLSLAPLFWAGNWVIGRALRGEIPPAALSFWRWAIGALILILLFRRELRPQWRPILRRWPTLMLLGITGQSFLHASVYQALTGTPAINATLFLSATPVLIVLAMAVFFGQRAGPVQLVGVVLSLCGAFLIIVRGDLEVLMGLRFSSSDLWLCLAAPLWAAYTILLVRRRPAELTPVALLVGIMIWGDAALLPIYLWTVLVEHQSFALTGVNLLSLGYIAIFASVVSYLCWNRGARELPPEVSGLFIHLLPVYATLLSILLLGERIRSYHLLGAAGVAAGIWLSSRRRAP